MRGVLILLLLVSCQPMCKESYSIIETKTIAEIGQCTEDVNNAWNGYSRGECMVKYTDGTIAKLKKPLIVGQKFTKTKTVCKRIK